MNLQPIAKKQKFQFNKLASHVIQSYEWGEAREQLSTKVLRYGIFKKTKLVKSFQLTLHPIPFTKFFVGYLPKGPLPDKEILESLIKIGNEHNCAFIKLEPNIENTATKINSPYLIKSPKTLFTKYNFLIDLTKSEDDLLKNMHPKTRYNIRIAQKHNVIVEERTDDAAFNTYLKLYFETTKRQGYHGHNEFYHKTIWEILKKSQMARILIAKYKNQPLTAWMLFNFKDTLYYPYGGSSKLHPEVMANNLIAWEAIKLGKKLKLKKFDMWGALGPNASTQDPWYGFHRFKMGYGGELKEYVGTYDLIFNKPIYYLFNFIDQLTPLKIFILKLINK